MNESEPAWGEERTAAGGQLRLRVADGIGRIELDNQEKLNALTMAMMTGMVELLDEIAGDDDIRVVVLTGAGERAFAAGADINQLDTSERGPDEPDDRFSGRVWETFQASLAAMAKPTLAAVRGYCLGGGLATAICTDIRIAATDSRFSIPAARLGVGYGSSGVDRLMNLVGPARAKLVLFTGMQFDAADAFAFGLVDRVVAPDRLWPETLAIAHQIADNAPLSLRAAKVTVDELLLDPTSRDEGRIEAHIGACMTSDDFREGRQAFLDKRNPRFVGR